MGVLEVKNTCVGRKQPIQSNFQDNDRDNFRGGGKRSKQLKNLTVTDSHHAGGHKGGQHRAEADGSG